MKDDVTGQPEVDFTDAEIELLIREYNKNRSELYTLDQSRGKAVYKLRTLIEQTFNHELPTGYRPYTLDYLSINDNTFLLVELTWRNQLTFQEQMVCTMLKIRASGHLRFVELPDRKVLGQITSESHPSVVRFNHEQNRTRPVPIWRKMCDPCNTYNSSFLLPYSGPFTMLHGNLRRLSQFAQTAMQESEQWATLCQLDTRRATIANAQLSLEQQAQLEALDCLDLISIEPLLALYPNIVQAMQQFDWTWQEADRAPPHYHENDRQFKALLKTVPYEHLRALWMFYSYAPLGYSSWRGNEWADNPRLDI